MSTKTKNVVIVADTSTDSESHKLNYNVKH